MTTPDPRERLQTFDAVIERLRSIHIVESPNRSLLPADRLPPLPDNESISFIDGTASGSFTADIPVEGNENETVFIDDL